MLKEEDIINLSWKKCHNFLPAIIQNYYTGEVLMHGYMNEIALRKTLNEKKITFFSRSKNRLWTKGESSNFFLELIDIVTDCDYDTLLVLVNPIGPTCHTGNQSCFSKSKYTNWNFIYDLEDILKKRKHASKEDSYTKYLYSKGINRIAQKLGEEALEVAIAAITNHSKKELINEISDLVYHLFILLIHKKIKFNAIIDELKKRNKTIIC